MMCRLRKSALPIHYNGHLHDDLSLRALYSTADAMVIPSRQGAVCSVGCGGAVSSGVRELLNPENGVNSDCVALTTTGVCDSNSSFAAQNRASMKELNIREMRANIGQLDELVAEEGELVISCRGQPIA